MTFGGYARISLDLAEGAGVERQQQDIAKYIEKLGGKLGDVRWYVDNGVSAYNRKTVRPEWQRLLADVESGIVTTLVVYNNDRALRQPRELEDLIFLAEKHGVRTHAATGQLDLSTDAGITMSRILVTMANAESRSTARRVARAHIQLAEQGKPSGGPRAFGFERNGITHRAEEVAVIREMAARALSGASLGEMVADLNERGIKPPRAERWTRTSLKGILINPRAAGLRALHGEIVGDAVWDPIISREQSEALRAVYADPDRKRPGQNTRQHLLAGFVSCSCGTPLLAKKRGDGKGQYVCRKDRGGCGRVARSIRLLDEAVTGYVMDALSSHDVPQDPDTTVADRLAAIQREVAELDTFYAAGDLPVADYVRQIKRLRAEEQQLGRQTARAVSARAIEDADTNWADMSLAQRRALIGSLISDVIVQPVQNRGPHGELELETVTILPR
jgi:site-specific DNA recombinase